MAAVTGSDLQHPSGCIGNPCAICHTSSDNPEDFILPGQKQLLTIGDKQTKLTTKENELLALLCSHANEILQRDFALKTIWIDDNYFNARSMDVYITKLRKHLKDDDQIEIINIHGKGYKLITPEEE